MRKIVLLGSVVLCLLIVVVIYFSMPFPPKTVNIPEKTEVPQNSEPTMQTEPESPPLYVFVTRNQLEYQVGPQKIYRERKIEEIEYRFEKLEQIEQRSGNPVERENPVVLNLQAAFHDSQTKKAQ